MICCLLALLMALPGVPMLRRIHLGRCRCTVHRGPFAPNHAATKQMAIAGGLAFAITAGLLMVCVHGAGIVSHPFGPICSAIDPATPAW